MEKYKDKVIIITGGNSGIDYATAKEFKAQSTNVIIIGKRKDALDISSKELGIKGILTDQSSLQDISNMVAEVKKGVWQSRCSVYQCRCCHFYTHQSHHRKSV